jgi:hypothetical protein
MRGCAFLAWLRPLTMQRGANAFFTTGAQPRKGWKIVRNSTTNERRTSRSVLLIAGVAALGLVSTAAAQADHGRRVTPPPVPAQIEVEAGNEAFLVGHATGTQNYVCLPSGSGVAWALFTPQATLFNDDGQQVITHFFSPNPHEGGIVRATWEHSRDTSTVWARAVGMATNASDPQFVAPGAIAWLLLNVKDTGAQAGPTGGDKLTGTTFIQRLNTAGGSAPATDCAVATDVGKKAFVPYTADYFFYRSEED